MSRRPEDINALARSIHAANHAWWHDASGNPIDRNRYELLALVISELSEALEGERKGIMDDHLPHRKMAEVEMADAMIRILDFSAGFGIPMASMAIDPNVYENRGHAIYEIMESVTNIGGSVFHETSASISLGYTAVSIESYCQNHGYDLWGAVEEKLRYNASRADHKHENRAKDGGKKF